jgi:hypothetical protein
MTKITNIDFLKERILLKATRERVLIENKMNIVKNRNRVLKQHINKYPDDVEIAAFLEKSKDELAGFQKILSKNDEEIHRTTSSFTCPISNCDGIVTKGHCQKCKTKICSKCLEESKSPHECNADTLKTIQLIKKETKNCPKCKVSIHKIDGCDQMFCTKCKTAFSWRTGQLQTGHIHNPHYFEWLRQRGTGVNLVFNDQDPCDNVLNSAIQFIFQTHEWIPRVLEELNILIPLLSSDIYNETSVNNKKQSLRLQHIRRCDGKTDRKKSEQIWFQQLRSLFRRKEMIKDIIKIFEILDRGIKDSVIVAYRSVEKNRIDVAIEQISSLFEYSKEQLIANQKRYNITNKSRIDEYDDRYGISCNLVRW